MKRWQDRYASKLVSAREALSHVRNGQTLFVHSGAAEPVLLTDTLAEMAPQFSDIEIIHLAAAQEESRLASPNLEGSFRTNTFFIGRGATAAVALGAADYTPMNIRDLPQAFADGVVLVDVALIQIAPPNAAGMASLGVSVDATRAAMEHARLVIAQVNRRMPTTRGDSMVPVDRIDFLVEGDRELIEVPAPELDPISFTIGRHIAGLIPDGATVHFDHEPISIAAMRSLDAKRDLGIHTDVLTDDLLRLIRSEAVTNRRKRINRGHSVATMVMGSRELYEAVDGNPFIEILPIDQVNDPLVIAQNDQMISVHSIEEIELTGLARADIEDLSQAKSLPTSMDFINGAARSRGGIVIMALPSTTADGQRSRIVALSTAGGVSFSRARAHYVVTEYGVVNLHGLSIRERAIALISIAHPKFRQQLLDEAKRFRYVGEEQVIAPESGAVYPHHYEFSHRFEDGTEVLFRPLRPIDARRLQRLFYSLSLDDLRVRYHGTITVLSNRDAQRMAAVDFSRDMAIVGLVGPRDNPRLIAEGRYTLNPSNHMGEFDIVVHPDFRGRGIGIFLANYLNKIAYARGLSGVYADVIMNNAATMALLNRAWPTAAKTFDSGVCTFTVRFPAEDVRSPKDSIIVYSGRFGLYSYGEGHPFQPGRARAAMQLIRQGGFLDEPWIRVEEVRPIPRERLIESHDPAFIEALEEAGDGAWKEKYLAFRLGGDDCPVFPGLFDYILLYTSATATGVDLIMNENANVVFNPLGGFHHASRSCAEGFCYVNDVIVAIDTFLARGYRVAYVDIDAHHGNGVQGAYYNDDRVLAISLHESGKTLYPWGGFETEIGEEIGRGFTINIPLPPETDDEAYGMAFDRVVVPALAKFAPSVVVAVIGTDAHKSDPLSHLSLTNNAFVHAVARIRDASPHLLLLGGGGYDPQSVARGWCRMWATANRIDSLPDYLLVVGGTFMGSHGLGAEIADMPYQITGEQKAAILKEVERVAAFHEAHTLPLIGRRR